MLELACAGSLVTERGPNMIVIAIGAAISFFALVVLAQLLWLSAQILASLRSDVGFDRPHGHGRHRVCRVCVIIPAHNEAISIANAIAAIKPQLRETDRLVVVADNCNDQTAVVALREGAEVIERHDNLRLGKGYALDYGIRFLSTGDAPEVVIFVDADCELAPGSVDELARICADRQRPAQAVDLMEADASAGSMAKIAQFAWKVKNYVRPLGANRLGFPCQLMGTGMAFPWPLISSAELATGHIVEDTKLGVDLMIAGHSPLYCSSARVTSKFTTSGEGTRIQRTRWEHGHLTMILEYVPRLLRSAYYQKSLSLFVMAVDLSIPPLGLMTLIIVILAIGGLSVALAGFPKITMGLTVSPAPLLGLMIWLAWLRHGHDILTLRDLLVIPSYAFSKIPMLWRFVFKRESTWVRSSRDAE
jgi:cellulose synthase/poly-beta-1,6-N-acetylglucosamine synthase-like glycosyltransferase